MNTAVQLSDNEGVYVDPATGVCSAGEFIYTPTTSMPGVGPSFGAAYARSNATGQALGYGLAIQWPGQEIKSFLNVQQTQGGTWVHSYLEGVPLVGGRIVFRTGDEPPLSPVFVTEDWQVARRLKAHYGYASVCCLSFENLAPVIAGLVGRAPERIFIVVYQGTDAEEKNPLLRLVQDQLLGSSKSDQIAVIPLGREVGIPPLDCQPATELLRAFFKTAAVRTIPWSTEARHPKLKSPVLPVPWSVDIDGQYLFERVVNSLDTRVRLDRESLVTISLWVILTYMSESFDFVPVLALNSPLSGSGKSTLLRVLEMLCRAGIGFEPVSRTDLRKLLEPDRDPDTRNEAPNTLLVDEAQELFGDRAVVASISSTFDRLAPGALMNDGKELIRRRRSGPTALAFRGKELPDALASRSVVLYLQRLVPEDALLPRASLIEREQQDELRYSRSMLRRWAADNRQRVVRQPPPDFRWRSPRHKDAVAPLAQIACAISDRLGQEFQQIAPRLFFESAEEADRRQLLACINDLARAERGEIFFTRDVLKGLVDHPNLPGGLKGLTNVGLARLLRPFDLRPKSKRVDTAVHRGYPMQQLRLAFRRYLRAEDDDVMDPPEPEN